MWVTLVLEELVELGVVEEVDERPRIINALNVVPKANGKFRIILDLRPFNKYMKALKFTMETIQRIRPLIKAGDYMGTIDLRSAYHHSWFTLLIVPSAASSGACDQMDMARWAPATSCS